MNVLVLAPFLPCLGKHGGSAQMFNLWTKAQALKDIHVHVLSYQTEMEEGCLDFTTKSFDAIDVFPTTTPDEWLLSDYCSAKDELSAELTFLLPSFTKRLVELLENENWDVVIIEMQFMMHFSKIIKKHSESKIGLVVHESMEQRYKSDQIMLQDFLNYEQCYEQYIDFYICFSDEDNRSLSHHNKQTHTLPLCVGMGELITEYRTPGEIVFLGAFNHQPNVDAVDYLLDDIMPAVKSPYSIKICGAQLSEDLRGKWCKHKNVELVGFVENALLVMAKCSVFVAPIISGKGVRTKVVEALSQNSPVITTSLGGEGIIANEGVDYLIADSPGEFSRAIDKVLRGEVVVGACARDKVNMHSPENVANNLWEILQKYQSDM